MEPKELKQEQEYFTQLNQQIGDESVVATFRTRSFNAAQEVARRLLQSDVVLRSADKNTHNIFTGNGKQLCGWTSQISPPRGFDVQSQIDYYHEQEKAVA